ncbi:hypothetical protein [Streptomyces klenkii]
MTANAVRTMPVEAAKEAEAGTVAARAALAAVKFGQKILDALGKARDHKITAEGCQSAAERAVEAAEGAFTRTEAEAAAAEAEAEAETAAEAVEECRKAFNRAKRARTECRKAAEVATGAPYETEADRAYESATDNVETAREVLGETEGAAEAAKEAAENARAAADRECLRCGEWACSCREIMCAMLARYGSGHVVDAEAVRIGELIMSDDDDLYAAGQMMLCGEWAEAEELVARATEGPAESEARCAVVRAAETTREAAPEQVIEERVVEVPEGMTGAPWFSVAEAAEYGAPRNAVSVARRALKAGWLCVLECVSIASRADARVWRVIASAMLRDAGEQDVFGTATVTAEWRGGKYETGAKTFNGKLVSPSLMLATVREAFTADTVTVVDRAAEHSGATYRGRDMAHWIEAGKREAERANGEAGRADDVKAECETHRGYHWGELSAVDVDKLMNGAWDADGVAQRRKCVPLWVDMVEHKVRAHKRRAYTLADRAEAAVRRVDLLAWEAEYYEREEGYAPEWAPTARDAWQHAQRARILADRAEAVAEAAESARLAAEAEAECAPVVAAEYERQVARDAQRAAEYPAESADDYAKMARGMFEEPRRAWVAWERDNWRGGETLGECYDRYSVICNGGWSSAELDASEANRHARNRAVFALGVEAAHMAEYTKGWDAERCTKLKEAAEYGQSLYTDRACPRRGERDAAAGRVWRMLIDTTDRWAGGGFEFMHIDRDIARLDAAGWAGTGACYESGELRRTLLVEHGLNLRTSLMTDMKHERDERTAARNKAVGNAHHAAKVKAVENGADDSAATAAGHRAGAPVRAAMDAERAAGDAAWTAALEHGERVTGGHMVLLGAYWIGRAHAARLAAEDAVKAERAAAEAVVEGDVEPPVEEAPRYRFGKREERSVRPEVPAGAYPVYVDDVATGHVYRLRRTWYAIGLDEARPTGDHKSRAEAAARLVGLVDVRAAVTADVARRERSRTEAPKGWTFVPWGQVEEGMVVRVPNRCKPVRGNDGLMSPETFTRPVTLTGVTRLDNGCVLPRGREEGETDPFVLLLTPSYAEIGALVPRGPAQNESEEAPVEGPASAVTEAAAEVVLMAAEAVVEGCAEAPVVTCDSEA